MSDSSLRVQKLIQRLQIPKYMVRLHAACLLGQMGADAKEAIPALLTLLRSEDLRDRKLAAWTLGYLGAATDEEAAAALRGASQDSEESLRILAASALERIGMATRPAA